MLYNLFADDIRLQKLLDPNRVESQVSALRFMKNVLSDVSKWMTANKLKLNESSFRTEKQL